MMTTWVTANASVIGSSHVATGTPCQDASVVKTAKGGEWVVIVVSDGAGTATRAEEGALHVVKFFSEELLKLVDELTTRAPGHWINDFVIEKVLQTRIALRQLAKSDDIRDFNCTVVACLLGPSGGFSIHIGDGAVVGGYRKESNDHSAASLFLSEPENGEYANETFFVTEGDWVKHLRISPMPKMDWVMCCTDGGSALALVAEKEIKPGFLDPVLQEVFVLNDEALRNKRLADYLSDPQADKVTGDDKTLAIAVKRENVLPLDQYLSLQLTKKNTQPGLMTRAPISGASPRPGDAKMGEGHTLSKGDAKGCSDTAPKNLKSTLKFLKWTIAFLAAMALTVTYLKRESLSWTARSLGSSHAEVEPPPAKINAENPKSESQPDAQPKTPKEPLKTPDPEGQKSAPPGSNKT
jgi:hypothetical protein